MLERFRGGPGLRPRRREHVYVDASFKASETDGERGVCGIGVWLPERGVAFALQLGVTTSMEGEILALLAGAITAKRFDVKRPVIFSDCRSAVTVGNRLLHVRRTRGFLAKLVHLAELADCHRAYARIFDALSSLGGTLEWQPRENNREADLASNIGSRLGNMGIVLSDIKNRNHALNDILSLAADVGIMEASDDGLVRRKFRCGTRTVGLTSRRTPSGQAFLREAPGLIRKLSAEVA